MSGGPIAPAVQANGALALIGEPLDGPDLTLQPVRKTKLVEKRLRLEIGDPQIQDLDGGIRAGHVCGPPQGR